MNNYEFFIPLVSNFSLKIMSVVVSARMCLNGYIKVVGTNTPSACRYTCLGDRRGSSNAPLACTLVIYTRHEAQRFLYWKFKHVLEGKRRKTIKTTTYAKCKVRKSNKVGVLSANPEDSCVGAYPTLDRLHQNA